MTQFFVNAGGVYLGAFDGAAPPPGAIEVPEAPTDARQVWNGTAYGPRPARFASDVRIDAYLAQLGKGDSPMINLIITVLETLVLEQVARGAAVTPAFTALVTKISQIRTANPGA